MGTFIIRPTVLVSGGTPYGVNTPPGGWNSLDFPAHPSILFPIANTVNLTLSAFSTIPGIGIPQTYDNTARFNFTGNSIYLDGSIIPIAFSGLPAGFVPITSSVKIIVLTIVNFPPSVARFFLQQAAGVESLIPNSTSFPYSFTIPPTILDIVNNGCGIHVNLQNDGSGNGNFLESIYNLRVEGIYEIQQSVFTITPAVSPVGRATRVNINRVSLNTPSCTQIRGVEIEYLDSNGNIVIVTAPIISQPNDPDSLNSLTFIIPPLPQFVLIIYIFILVPDLTSIPPSSDFPIQFSGRVLLGSLPVLIANASGIYALVPGKTNDTLYDRAGTTVNFEIPSPFGKTGFIGG